MFKVLNMKKKEVKKLLELFDRKDRNSLDFSGFNEPETAKEHYNNHPDR